MECHIISIGNSIISNLAKKGLIKTASSSDESYFNNLLDDKSFLRQCFDIVKANPAGLSAELNSFIRYTQQYSTYREPAEIRYHLVGTNTASNDICRVTIDAVLKERGHINEGADMQQPGYFHELITFSEHEAHDKFIKGISESLERTIRLIRKKREEGFQVLINPTGGFKAYVMSFAMAGFLTNCRVYYLHEEFKEVVLLPPLFYLPTKTEEKLLMELQSDDLISGERVREILERSGEMAERLQTYGLVTISGDSGTPFGIRITERGKWVLDELKKREGKHAESKG